jgi:hypothetical protein
MQEKIDPGLFARLMQIPAAARTDLLEYIGQGPVSTAGALSQAHAQDSRAGEAAHPRPPR